MADNRPTREQIVQEMVDRGLDREKAEAAADVMAAEYDVIEDEEDEQ